ncbi:hypothetical protein MAR_015704 [Mya arenaria]|uniref:Uncharacterized protein n=1 Tax=Mya arenaria TaxID=6604 RepID=A0ABY7FHS8_MYAAR|nr:hypothetical protein MAR_015704 [Mya arenaria]
MPDDRELLRKGWSLSATVPDRECVGRYRLTKDAILRLEAALNADLEPSTNRTMSVSSMTKNVAKRIFKQFDKPRPFGLPR